MTLQFKEIMPAVTKGIGDGRGTAFRDDPSEANRDAILAAVKSNLDALIKKYGKKGKK